MSLHDAVAKYVENGDTLAIGGFTTNRKPEPIVHIEDLEAYNEKEGLALS